jgi:hypothetical protein
MKNHLLALSMSVLLVACTTVPPTNVHQPMTMRDWATELDNFLRLTRKDILTHAGKVPAKSALAKAEAAYAEYQARVRNLPSPVEKDFEAAIAQPVKQLEKGRKALPRPKKKGDA